MEFLLLLIGAGALLYNYASHLFEGDVETIGDPMGQGPGVRHFTLSGHKEALKALAGVDLTISAAVLEGAATFVTAPHQSMGVTGFEAVQQAEAQGGVVLLSEAFVDHPVGALFVVTSRGNEGNLAKPGSGLAVLSITG